MITPHPRNPDKIYNINFKKTLSKFLVLLLINLPLFPGRIKIQAPAGPSFDFSDS